MDIQTLLINKSLLQPSCWDNTTENDIDVIYLGYCYAGVMAESDNKFLIVKITDPSGTGTRQFAEGNNLFDKSWTDRAQYSYSFLQIPILNDPNAEK